MASVDAQESSPVSGQKRIERSAAMVPRHSHRARHSSLPLGVTLLWRNGAPGLGCAAETDGLFPGTRERGDNRFLSTKLPRGTHQLVVPLRFRGHSKTMSLPPVGFTISHGLNRRMRLRFWADREEGGGDKN